MDQVIKTLEAHAGAASLEDTNRLLGTLIQPEQCVGHVYSMSYGSALVQVHDHQRGKAGGIPGLSFLIATRKEPKDDLDFENESASVLLLRVLDSAPLPTDTFARMPGSSRWMLQSTRCTGRFQKRNCEGEKDRSRARHRLRCLVM